MGMAYVRIFFDWVEATQALNFEEKGRLIDAIIRYARDPEADLEMPGNERFVFPTFMQQVDRDAANYERVCTKASYNARAGALFKDKDKEKDKDEEQDEDMEPSVLKKIDNNWRTSARARGGAAQLLVDACLSENLPCGGMKNLFDELLSAMETGLSPEEILSCCRSSGGTNLGYELYTAMKKRGLSAR